MSWPDGDRCPDCGHKMTVRSVCRDEDGDELVVARQSCAHCQIDWSVLCGFVDVSGERAEVVEL